MDKGTKDLLSASLAHFLNRPKKHDLIIWLIFEIIIDHGIEINSCDSSLLDSNRRGKGAEFEPKSNTY